jgi:type I restriction enzyme S subunit
VTKGKFESTKINLPPCKEQKRIVAKIEELFSELDNGIAALKTAREQLKVYRQAVLKHAFEGKLTAQWRKESGVSQSTWREMTVKELAVLGPSNGKSVKDLAGGFPVLRLTALKKGKVDLDEFKEGAWSAKEASSYLVQNGDFLFSRGNGSKHLVGRGGLVREPKSKVAFPDTIMRIRLDTEKVKPEYFSYAWESRLIRKQIEQSARTTAGIYKINQQHVKGFTLPIPPVSEQKIISSLLEEKISSIDALLYDTEQQLLKTETLRQSILKKAFSGQLVPQDPNDEPASELLARIKAEKVAQKAAEKAQQAAGKKPTAKRGRKLREPVQ